MTSLVKCKALVDSVRTRVPIRKISFCCVLVLCRPGRRGASAVGASDLGPEGLKFEPWPVRLRCVLRQNT